MSAGLQETSDCWGFPYVMHAWGVQSVVSTLWPTLDVAMLLLFAEFYQSLRAQNGPTTALRHAQRCLRQLSSEEACNRLRTICAEDEEAFGSLHAQLHVLVLRCGADAPFASPVLWGAAFCSGVHEVMC